MQIRSGGRLAAAFACVFMLAGSAVAADSAPAIDALRDIAVRVDAATRETVAAHSEHRAVAAATTDATKRARGEFDAIVRAAPAQGFANDASFARKQRQVGRLLANLERAAAAPADAALPALVATSDPDRTAHIAAGGGASCASALTIGPGYAVDTNLAAGATLWLRVAPAKEGYTRLDTAPTPLDTEITLFGAKCPASDAEATARSDDALGLAAAVALDAQGGVRYARVRNLGRAGHVVARVGTAAAILGRITDERNGRPLEARVQTVTVDGYVFGYMVDADAQTGLYLLTVDPGNYYVIADDVFSGPQSYVTELYPDAPCAGTYVYDLSTCDIGDATALALGDGQQVSGIDLALNIGGRIAGVVRSAADGTPLPASIVVYDSTGNYVNYGIGTDAAGRYTISGLLTGTYYIVASTDGFRSQLWDHIDCGDDFGNNCPPLDGTPLGVVRNELTQGVDFDLTREAHIHATVSARDDAGVPLQNWALALYTESGTYMGMYFGYGTTLDTGALQPGTYRAFATASGYFGQVWNGIDCMTDCSAEEMQGTVITLAESGVADISFALLSIPTVSGTITDAASHAPIAGTEVILAPVNPATSGVSVYTDANGRFTISPYQTGDYYLWAWEAMHRGTVYPDGPCGSRDFSTCDLSNAVRMTIAYGGASIVGADIAMPLDGSVAGNVTMHVPDGVTPIDAVPFYENVVVFYASGDYAGSTLVDVNGNYVLPGLPAGTYYAVASGYGFGQLYDGRDCDGNCIPSTGTPIVLAQGENRTGIDFDPIPSDYIFGRVTDGGGAGVFGVAIDLWSASDSSHCGVGITNANGYYAVQSSSYACSSAVKVSTDIDPALYENQVYDGIFCPQGSVYLGLCGLDNGMTVTLPSTPVFVTADFVLGPRPDPIFAGGFDP